MLTILVASVAGFIFGAIWFTALFGKTWAKLNGFNTEGSPSMDNMVKQMVANFLVQVILVSVVYYLLHQLLVLEFIDFLRVTLVIWLGFSFPIYANAAIWERKSWNLVVLNSAYGLLMTTIVSYLVYIMN